MQIVPAIWTTWLRGVTLQREREFLRDGWLTAVKRALCSATALEWKAERRGKFSTQPTLLIAQEARARKTPPVPCRRVHGCLRLRLTPGPLAASSRCSRCNIGADAELRVRLNTVAADASPPISDDVASDLIGRPNSTRFADHPGLSANIGNVQTSRIRLAATISMR